MRLILSESWGPFVRPRLAEHGRGCSRPWPSDGEFLQQPGHIGPEVPHGLHPFLVLFHLSGVSAIGKIPVAGARENHLAGKEKGDLPRQPLSPGARRPLARRVFGERDWGHRHLDPRPLLIPGNSTRRGRGAPNPESSPGPDLRPFRPWRQNHQHSAGKSTDMATCAQCTGRG